MIRETLRKEIYRRDKETSLRVENKGAFSELAKLAMTNHEFDGFGFPILSPPFVSQFNKETGVFRTHLTGSRAAVARPDSSVYA